MAHRQLINLCLERNLAAAKTLLIENKVLVNRSDEQLRTALSVATSQFDIPMVELLLSHAATNPNIPGPAGKTPLLIAVSSGNAELVKLFLSHPRIDVNVPSETGVTPLHALCLAGDVELLREVLADDRFDVNWPKNDGATPVYSAVVKGRIKVVLLLLQSPRLDFAVTKLDGSTLLMAACSSSRPYFRVIFERLMARDPQIAKSLNDSRADGFTALHIAAERGGIQAITELLKMPNINVNVVTKEHLETPLHLAGRAGREEAVKLLVQFPQTHVNAQNRAGQTPLHYACSGGNLEIVKLLLSHPKLRVNVRDCDSETPFYTACAEGHLEVVKLLLEFPGVALTRPNKARETPFAASLRNGHTSVSGHLSRSPKISRPLPKVPTKLRFVPELLKTEDVVAATPHPVRIKAGHASPVPLKKVKREPRAKEEVADETQEENTAEQEGEEAEDEEEEDGGEEEENVDVEIEPIPLLEDERQVRKAEREMRVWQREQVRHELVSVKEETLEHDARTEKRDQHPFPFKLEEDEGLIGVARSPPPKGFARRVGATFVPLVMVQKAALRPVNPLVTQDLKSRIFKNGNRVDRVLRSAAKRPEENASLTGNLDDTIMLNDSDIDVMDEVGDTDSAPAASGSVRSVIKSRDVQFLSQKVESQAEILREMQKSMKRMQKSLDSLLTGAEHATERQEADTGRILDRLEEVSSEKLEIRRLREELAVAHFQQELLVGQLKAKAEETSSLTNEIIGCRNWVQQTAERALRAEKKCQALLQGTLPAS